VKRCSPPPPHRVDTRQTSQQRVDDGFGTPPPRPISLSQSRCFDFQACHLDSRCCLLQYTGTQSYGTAQAQTSHAQHVVVASSAEREVLAPIFPDMFLPGWSYGVVVRFGRQYDLILCSCFALSPKRCLIRSRRTTLQHLQAQKHVNFPHNIHARGVRSRGDRGPPSAAGFGKCSPWVASS